MFRTMKLVAQSEHQRDNYKEIVVDMTKSSYRGTPLNQCGEFGRRKFENMVVIENSPRRVKVIYPI